MNEIASTKTRKRCAVYCRVSTDERLDQEFNSSDAQKEAGHAYIASQRTEGWISVADDYDDPGFSGGNTDRPALKRLLADIERGQIDIVVVYKIDRLTRSLADFSKMVEVPFSPRIRSPAGIRRTTANKSNGVASKSDTITCSNAGLGFTSLSFLAETSPKMNTSPSMRMVLHTTMTLEVRFLPMVEMASNSRQSVSSKKWKLAASPRKSTPGFRERTIDSASGLPDRPGRNSLASGRFRLRSCQPQPVALKPAPILEATSRTLARPPERTETREACAGVKMLGSDGWRSRGHARNPRQYWRVQAKKTNR